MAKYNGQTVTVTAVEPDNTFVTIELEDLSSRLVALGAVGELTPAEKNLFGQPV